MCCILIVFSLFYCFVKGTGYSPPFAAAAAFEAILFFDSVMKNEHPHLQTIHFIDWHPHTIKALKRQFLHEFATTRFEAGSHWPTLRRIKDTEDDNLPSLAVPTTAATAATVATAASAAATDNPDRSGTTNTNTTRETGPRTSTAGRQESHRCKQQ